MDSRRPQSQTIGIKYKTFADSSAFISNNWSINIFTKYLGPKDNILHLLRSRAHTSFVRPEILTVAWGF